MKSLYFFFLLAVIVGQASAACKCTTFLKPKLISQYDYSVLYYPRDNITSMPCNPVRCIYTLEINELHGIGGNIYYVRNFLKSEATLKFYNGKDISATPYFQLDGNTKNSDLVVTHPSYEQYITMVLDVKSAITKDFPTFIYYATGSKQGTTTTTTQASTSAKKQTSTVTSTTSSASTTTSTTAQVPSPTTTTQTPIIFQSPIGSDSIVVPKFEGDLALLLDIKSKNLTKLSEIAQELIDSLNITPFTDSKDARVNVILYDNGTVLPYGWNLDKKSLDLITGNLLRTIGNDFNAFNVISLDSFISSVFEESKSTRKHIQRVALFVTDNEQIRTHLSNQTIISTDFLGKTDILPVFVSFTDGINAEAQYNFNNVKFTGTSSDFIVFHNVDSTSNLFENILLNQNIMCNADYFTKKTYNSVSIPSNYKKRNCNEMNVVTYCERINLEQPITISFEKFDLEPQHDNIAVFDDKSVLQNNISGHKINHLKITVLDSSFVKVVLTNGSTKIFKGGNYTFENCIIRS